MTKLYMYNNSSMYLFEFVRMISLDRNYYVIHKLRIHEYININLLFVLFGLYLNILKTEKILHLWRKILDARVSARG